MDEICKAKHENKALSLAAEKDVKPKEVITYHKYIYVWEILIFDLKNQKYSY